MPVNQFRHVDTEIIVSLQKYYSSSVCRSLSHKRTCRARHQLDHDEEKCAPHRHEHYVVRAPTAVDSAAGLEKVTSDDSSSSIRPKPGGSAGRRYPPTTVAWKCVGWKYLNQSIGWTLGSAKASCWRRAAVIEHRYPTPGLSPTRTLGLKSRQCESADGHEECTPQRRFPAVGLIASETHTTVRFGV